MDGGQSSLASSPGLATSLARAAAAPAKRDNRPAGSDWTGLMLTLTPSLISSGQEEEGTEMAAAQRRLPQNHNEGTERRLNQQTARRRDKQEVERLAVRCRNR